MLVAQGGQLFAQKSKRLSDTKLREAEFYFTEGEKYFILEDYSKALVLFQKSLDINPDNATVYYKIGEIYSKSSDTQKALENSLKAVELESDNKYFYVQLANLYTQAGNFEKAAETYELLTTKLEKTDIYLFELAALYLYQQRYDDALVVYDKIEKSYGISEEITSQKQKIYLQINQLDNALAEGDKLILAYPGEELYVARQAEILLSNDKTEQAKSLLQDYVVSYPDAYSTRMMLAEIMRQEGNMEEALQILLLIFNNPDLNADNKIQLLAQYRATMQAEQLKVFAEPLAEALVTTHKDVAEANIIYADILQQQGDYISAKSFYASAISADPSNLQVWQNLIQLHFELQEIDSVIHRSEMALELFPNQSMLYYYNGAANLQRNNNEEAVYALEQGKRLSSANLGLLSAFNAMLGDAYHHTGEYPKSDQAYEAALDFDPQNDGVLNNYSYFLSLRKEQLEKAEKMAKSVIDRNPDNVTFLDTYAWVLYTREKYKEARRVMEKAIEIGGVEAIHYEHYGDILFQLGDVDGAVKQWQVAKGMDPNSELIDKKIADRKLYE